MKTFAQYMLFFGATFALLACDLNPVSSFNGESSSSAVSNAEIPVMDNRVVAYLRVEESDGVKGFIDDIETLKSWFPPYENVLYNDECNYFAVTFPVENDKSYMILSQDMTLYSIQPDPTGKKNGCDFYYPPIISYQAMLVCDDKAGTIKNNLNFKSSVAYVDPNWDCERESLVSKNVYFTYASSSSNGEPVVATEMPIMDNRVVAYQKARWSEQLGFKGIIDNTDTLKSWFPNDYDEQKECNYFAIFNSTSSTGCGYLVLANDMVLYSLKYNPALGNMCGGTGDIFYDVMLVCDDEANTFKNNINLNGSYVIPNWNCEDWRTTPEKGHFSKSPITP